MIDIVIVGAGIVGMHLAHALAKRFPEYQIWVLEKEDTLFHHTSARNSGVLHAGLYYPFQSLKHVLCQRGLELWQLNWPQVRQEHCGKFVFAPDEQSLAKLNELFLIASKNSVAGLRWASALEIEKLAEFCHVRHAFYSPATGIIDASQALQFMRDACEELGVSIINPCGVSGVEKNASGSFCIDTTRGLVDCKVLINAAGLGAVGLRQMLGLDDLENYYVKGHYLRYTGDFWKDGLLYPTPPAHGLGLGLHATINMDREVRFGPDTMETQGLEYNYEQKLERYVPELLKLYPQLNPDKLSLDFCGIRPKLKDRTSKKLLQDFWIKGPEDVGIANYVELCGIESPGFTASPAIAEFVLKHWFS